MVVIAIVVATRHTFDYNTAHHALEFGDTIMVIADKVLGTRVTKLGIIGMVAFTVLNCIIKPWIAIINCRLIAADYNSEFVANYKLATAGHSIGEDMAITNIIKKEYSIGDIIIKARLQC
jgi:hypothetical protein